MAEFFVQVSDDLTDDAGAPSFQSYHYRTMQLDACRMAHYRRDIARLAPGARVLEVGPGPLAVLSTLCLAAGAKEVVAVEMVGWAAEAAREALAADPRARVLHKHTGQLGAEDVGGDTHYDLLVHECYGCVASREGVVETVAALRANGFTFARVVSRGFQTQTPPAPLCVALRGQRIVSSAIWHCLQLLIEQASNRCTKH